jgi:hypothetical protein
VAKDKGLTGGTVSDEDSAAMKIGETTRSEIVARTGRPTVSYFDDRAIGYFWSKRTWDFDWEYLGILPNFNEVIHNSGTSGIVRKRMLMMTFDSEGRLQNHRMFSAMESRVVHNNSYDWAKKQVIQTTPEKSD